MSRSLLALALALAIPTTLPAQAAPNLSGTWVLDMDRTDFGMMQGGPRTDVITHTEPVIHIERTAGTPQGEVKATIHYVVDGKPHKNTVGPNEVTSVLRWDGAVLEITSTLMTAQGELTILDRYTLSQDGKTMTVARTLSAGGQEMGQTMVYTKG